MPSMPFDDDFDDSFSRNDEDTDAEVSEIPLSERTAVYRRLQEEAADGTSAYACAWDATTRSENDYRLTIRLGLDEQAKSAAFETARDWHGECRDNPICHEQVRVFRLQEGEVYHVACFSGGHEYMDDDFRDDGHNGARTYSFKVGPNEAACTMTFHENPQPVLEPIAGDLSDDMLIGEYCVIVPVRFAITPPSSSGVPPFQFDSRVRWCQRITVCGSDVDLRFRIVRYIGHTWLRRKRYPVFEDGRSRRSLRFLIRRHWPTFSDKEFSRSLEHQIGGAIREWLYRTTYDRPIGTYCPTVNDGPYDRIDSRGLSLCGMRELKLSGGFEIS